MKFIDVSLFVARTIDGQERKGVYASGTVTGLLAVVRSRPALAVVTRSAVAPDSRILELK